MMLLAWVGIACALAASAGHSSETFTIDGKKITFDTEPKSRVTVSADCLKSSGPPKCAAFSAIARASGAGSKSQGGSNFGALVCRKLGGKSALGRDAKGNENSFCRFADGSLVDNGTLSFYARQNDEKPSGR